MQIIHNAKVLSRIILSVMCYKSEMDSAHGEWGGEKKKKRQVNHIFTLVRNASENTVLQQIWK